ncbi:MAG: hypothetical protein CVV47_03180 [Spirochaetae bacterium HGW-Spirochaetae-3]|jgi:hypothetical protein|nr:MAG: hypothetical protein CVV47_03180 [Spirochaetae bacterium HGW-Spirochaetae-3]
MRISKTLLAIGMACVLVFGAFAQSRVTLTVIASEGPAQVILDGKLLGVGNPKFTAQVRPGTYDLIVRKSGLPEFRQRITVGGGGLTVNAQLGGTATIPAPTPTQPPATQSYSITVTANVTGADVFINGIQAGRTPFTGQVSRGSYTVVVKAPGYSDYTQGISVTGAAVVNATLTPMLVPLNLGNLFPGAEIFLNGARIGVAGGTQFITQVAPGTYTLTVRAGGFMDFSMQITVGAGGYSLAPTLQPMMANYVFQIPAGMTNPDVHGNPWSQIRLYIDGAAQKDFRGQIQPGRHTIRMVTGAFQIEFIQDFESGKSYTIEPFAGMTVK